MQLNEDTSNSMTTYSSMAGFYTVEYPENWRISCEGNIVNIFPPEANGAVTISAFHGIGASLNESIGQLFKNYQAVSPPHPVSRNNWNGLQAEYLQQVDEGFRYWVVIGAIYRKTLVLITANDTKTDMTSQRHIYESILYSLVLTDPEEF